MRENPKLFNLAHLKRRLKWGGLSDYPYQGWDRVGVWTGKLKNPTKCLWRRRPQVKPLLQPACTSFAHLGQGYVKERLKSSLRKFYGRYGDLTKQYEVPLSRMLHDILDDDHIQ